MGKVMEALGKYDCAVGKRFSTASPEEQTKLRNDYESCYDSWEAYREKQAAGSEWDTLNQEAMELYRTGRYDRGVLVAKKALEVAEKNVGPNHLDVATSLNNLALLYYTQRTALPRPNPVRDG